MGVVNTYLSAVAAGALTAGLAAANIVAVPPDTAVSPQPSARDVDLAAEPIEIPIIDIGPTPGPLSIWRQLSVLVGLDPLTAGLKQHAGNTYDLPGLDTTVDSNTKWIVQAIRGADFVDFGASSEQGQTGSWELLGIVASSATTDNARNLHFKPLLGGTGGIGAALYGTLSDANYTRTLEFFDSGLDRAGHRTVGDFNGELALMPFDGFKAVGDATVIATNSDSTFNLGSLTGVAHRTGTLDGRAGLCLGSAQGTTSCGGDTAFLEVGAPVTGDLTLGTTNIISGDFSTNRVVAKLGQGQFSVTGAVGGTFTVGNLEIGRPIPIDIQIPRTPSVMSLSGDRPASTVRESFKATPRKLGSDNETGGRHRAGPLRDAIADVKKAVDNAVNGKHAKPEAED